MEDNRYYLLHRKELAQILGRDENDPLTDYRDMMSAPLVRRDDGVFGNLTDDEWNSFVSLLVDSDNIANEISDTISDYFTNHTDKVMSYYTSEPGAYSKKEYVPIRVLEEVYRTKIINIPKEEYEKYKEKWDSQGYIPTDETSELYERYNTVSKSFIEGYSVIRTYIGDLEYDNDGKEVSYNGKLSKQR